MDKFPACFDQNIGMNLEEVTYLFLRNKRESSAILVGLISDSRLYQQDFLSYYINTPNPILFFTLHTRLYSPHNLSFPVKDVKALPLRLLEAQHATPLPVDSSLNHKN